MDALIIAKSEVLNELKNECEKIVVEKSNKMIRVLLLNIKAALEGKEKAFNKYTEVKKLIEEDYSIDSIKEEIKCKYMNTDSLNETIINPKGSNDTIPKLILMNSRKWVNGEVNFEDIPEEIDSKCYPINAPSTTNKFFNRFHLVKNHNSQMIPSDLKFLLEINHQVKNNEE